MDETNYRPNSHKYKTEQRENEAEQKRVEKVVTGAVKTKKKNEIRKLADVFIAEDARNVKSYVLIDILVPAIKKAVSDIVTNGIDMILYGGSNPNGKKAGSSKISYTNYYDRRDDHHRPSSATTRARFDYDDIIFSSRGEAEAVREEMNNVIERYGFVTVADMYDMAELSQPYTSNKYGWTSIRTAEVVRVRDGYILKLPKALPID